GRAAVLRGRARGSCGSDRRRRRPQPVLQRARARLASAVPRGTVSAAARGVRRRGPGRRLRGRRHGALRLRRRLRRRAGRAAQPARRSRPAGAVGDLRRRAVRRAVHCDARLGSAADRHQRRRRARQLRLAGGDRHAAADEVPGALRGRVVSAADRRRRRGRARAPPRRPDRNRGAGAVQRDGHPAPRLYGHDGRGRRRAPLAAGRGDEHADARRGQGRGREL
ncbi:MAG: NADH-ubiquinone oxidoreductase chain J, partial [uncultured Solirubrobacteraceae bacterium]